jgi:hypothetical protein
VIEGSFEIKALPELRRGQTMELVAYSASSQQVGAPALHLASTGAAESEANSAILVQPVHLVE